MKPSSVGHTLLITNTSPLAANLLLFSSTASSITSAMVRSLPYSQAISLPCILVVTGLDGRMTSVQGSNHHLDLVVMHTNLINFVFFVSRPVVRHFEIRKKSGEKWELRSPLLQVTTSFKACHIHGKFGQLCRSILSSVLNSNDSDRRKVKYVLDAT